MPKLTRRQFLAHSVELGGLASTVPALVSCGDSTPLSGPVATLEGPAASLTGFHFTDLQRRALAAAVARLVPASGPGDWSATDAGAVEYIEQLLNAFSTSGIPRLYGGGPTRAQFADFHALSRAKRAGWQREVLRLRALYVEGLDGLNRQSPPANDFSAQTELVQDLLLESLDLQANAFFGTLFEHTMEACYGHPVYGGNRDYVGWDSVCYQGDVHGVRFPGGADPAADAEPWRKFGGYAPEEIGAPGSCADLKGRP